MRPGVRLGVDVGTARIGIARSDPHGMLATPVETVPRGPGDLDRIREIALEVEAMEIVVGLPLALSGRETASTDDARGFAQRIASAALAPVRLVDERLSTVSAAGALRQAGRDARSSRSVIDQVAAVIILQDALDAERATDIPSGALVALEQGS